MISTTYLRDLLMGVNCDIVSIVYNGGGSELNVLTNFETSLPH